MDRLAVDVSFALGFLVGTLSAGAAVVVASAATAVLAEAYLRRTCGED